METVPQAIRVAIVWDPASRGSPGHVRETQIATRALGMQLQSLEVRDPGGLDAAFQAVVKGRADALIVVGAGWMNSHRARVVELAAKTRLPAIYTGPAWVNQGGLMSYAADLAAQFRRAAGYVDKILKGAKPGDLPVEQPTKFDLVINLKTAKALGLTIPSSLLARADQIIE
jgi:putative ABC transport system substrate-binding protein